MNQSSTSHGKFADDLAALCLRKWMSFPASQHQRKWAAVASENAPTSWAIHPHSSSGMRTWSIIGSPDQAHFNSTWYPQGLGNVGPPQSKVDGRNSFATVYDNFEW